MMKEIVRTFALGGVAWAVVGTPSLARVEAAAKSAPPGGGKTQIARIERGAPGSAADTIPKSVMDEITRYAMPGPPHKELEAFVGSWKSRTRAWHRPDSRPLEFLGNADYRMILGGR